MTAGADSGAAAASLSELSALSSVDGRYRADTAALSDYFSEGAFIRYRIRVELAWLRAVAAALRPAWLSSAAEQNLQAIWAAAQTDEALRAVKRLEAETRHDVKAVEYWIAQALAARDMAAWRGLTHFACTSWDINNVAFSLQMQEATRAVMAAQLDDFVGALRRRAAEYAAAPMLARTHGQPASPTTMGKELANVAARLAPLIARLRATVLPAKMNGATGNFNAHMAAAPEVDWRAVTRACVEGQGLRYALLTTQIEPYDELAALFDAYRRVNVVLLDFARDCWGYIALDYFSQAAGGGREAGSSTMPHKINPIDFEKAEGNLGVANALLGHLSDKLPVSRWQRDLSDSTALRAVGSALGHSLVAWRSVAVGLGKIRLNEARLRADLDANWQVLGEAIQTALRAAGVADAYEQVRDFSRGKAVDAASVRAFIRGLALADDVKARLLALTPATYCGLAPELAREAEV